LAFMRFQRGSLIRPEGYAHKRGLWAAENPVAPWDWGRKK
jgi:hypothetical protein